MLNETETKCNASPQNNKMRIDTNFNIIGKQCYIIFIAKVELKKSIQK